MEYAQIRNGVIYNVIILNDDKLIGLFSQGFDYFINITNLDPKPGIDWLYNGEDFTPPL